MLNKEQSDVIAEALLSPAREARETAQKRIDEQRRKRVAYQRFAWLGLVGLAIGAAIGHIIFGKIYPAALVGMAIGFIIARFLSRHAV